MGGWDDPDVGLLFDVNGLANHTPHWVDRTVAFLGEHGLVAVMVLMLLGAWWYARRRVRRAEAVVASAGVLWAGLAGCLAYLVNIPIRAFVARPRPFETHEGLEVLVGGKAGHSFVSDHSGALMAVAVGLYMVNRRLGLIGILVALVQGLCRVYVGVHYPTDVIGGLALGTAVALLLAPGALAALTPLLRWTAGTRAGWLVQERRPREEPAGAPGDGEVGEVSSVGSADPVRPTGPSGGAVGDDCSGKRDLAA